MRVLVTGATGFIGSHVADKLLQKGYRVRCIARKSSNLRWLEGKDFEIVEASLDNQDSLVKAVDGVDYIYHVAGLTFAR
ncbi:MAG TPA: NAD-dependent epimerase/dehydratase family protein, partial [Candidatus Kapabacteria bacterium]|nr:NAD-dependent epimerase/dehydratase family protein [Candidatus Kapabacteria bacterium]